MIGIEALVAEAAKTVVGAMAGQAWGAARNAAARALARRRGTTEQEQAAYLDEQHDRLAANTSAGAQVQAKIESLFRNNLTPEDLEALVAGLRQPTSTTSFAFHTGDGTTIMAVGGDGHFHGPVQGRGI